MEILSLKNLNPISFVHYTPISFKLCKTHFQQTKVAQDYISTQTLNGQRYLIQGHPPFDAVCRFEYTGCISLRMLGLIQ